VGKMDIERRKLSDEMDRAYQVEETAQRKKRRRQIVRLSKIDCGPKVEGRHSHQL